MKKSLTLLICISLCSLLLHSCGDSSSPIYEDNNNTTTEVKKRIKQRVIIDDNEIADEFFL